MKVSIVTVVYNGAHTIAEAVESVLAQDYPDLEYIVVDGASKPTKTASPSSCPNPTKASTMP